ncbi:MAG: hypothetical protein WCJ64_00580 [Rhodospirillaceae bacterium]
MAYPKLTDEEHAAIRAYAAGAGRNWKSQLRAAWIKASMPRRLLNALPMILLALLGFLFHIPPGQF